MFKTDGKYETRNGSMTAQFLCEIRQRNGSLQTVFLVKDKTSGDEGITRRDINGKHPDESKTNWDIVKHVEKTSKCLPVFSRFGSTIQYDSLAEARNVGHSHRTEVSTFVGVVENKFEDGVYVRSVFHKEPGVSAEEK